MSSDMNDLYTIHHDDFFSLWTGNGGTVVGASYNDETKNPMPYNMDNGMFAIAKLDRPIETHRWHIIALHSKTWIEAGNKAIKEYGGINLITMDENQPLSRIKWIYPIKEAPENN